MPASRRLEAWHGALGRLLDRSASARRELEGPLARACRLSDQGLDAGLEAVTRGLLGDAAQEVFDSAARRPADRTRAPALVVLASNLPGLALQTVLPALARGRALILRSSRREPLFAPALVRALAAVEPVLGEAFAALTSPHGSPLETTLLERCDPVLVYGGREVLDALRPRVEGRLIEYGPKLSIALVGAGASDDEIRLLARDVALFDQRGCLSVQIVLSLAPAERVAASLVSGLDRQAVLLPPGPATLGESSALRRELDLAVLRGHTVAPASAGWVVTESAGTTVRPSPGRRLVRLQPLGSLEELGGALAPIAASIQGVALAGLREDEARPALHGVGVSRLAPAGRLQETDARWQNGGIDPLEVL